MQTDAYQRATHRSDSKQNNKSPSLDSLEDDDEVGLAGDGVSAFAVDGEIVVAPEDLGAVIDGAAEALYTRERCARRLRGEECGRVERAVEGFTDDAAHGAAAFDSGKRSKMVLSTRKMIPSTSGK